MGRLPYNLPNFDQPVFWDSSKSLARSNLRKHLRNLKRWNKFIKRSQIVFRFEYIHYLKLYTDLTLYTQCSLNLETPKEVSRLIGLIKIDCKNIFNRKKTDVIIPFQSIV